MVPKAGQLIREALERSDRECASNETTQCMQELIDKVARLAQRECELLQKVQQLEHEKISLRKAGHKLAMEICKIVLYKKIDIQALQALSDAISRWERAKEGAE